MGANLGCNFNVALLNDEEFAKELGKKGTSTDFTVYNLKQGEDSFCFFYPHQYPDKIQSLINVLALTDSTVFVVHKLDQYLGEMIVALDLLGKGRGLIIFDDYVEKDKFISLVAGTSIEKLVITSKKPFDVYEKLKQHCTIDDGAGEEFRMNVDAYFDVKSVGTVVLGAIKNGQVNVHDELQLYPSDRKVTVKSLQVHDQDVKNAAKGSRVGLALKGVSAEELDRGVVIAKPGSLQAGNEITVETIFSKYYAEKIEVGKQYFISIGMQYKSAKLMDMKETGDLIKKKILKFQVQSSIAYAKDDQVLVVDLNSKMRICGVGAVV